MATIAEQLTSLANTKTAIKDAIVAKGVVIADTDPFSAYATKIGQISSGGTPSYIPRKVIDSTGKLVADPTQTTFSIAPATDVDSYSLYYGLSFRTNLTSADLSSLTTVSGSYAMNSCFANCTNLTSVDLSSLTTISGSNAMYYCFKDCTGLTSVDLLSLTTISGSYAMNDCFHYCSNLTSIDLSSLTTISTSSAMASCFNNCSKLSKISFPSLTTVHNKAFGTASYDWCFKGCTALTEIHFRADAQATIEVMTGYADKWGATNATIYFDL